MLEYVLTLIRISNFTFRKRNFFKIDLSSVTHLLLKIEDFFFFHIFSENCEVKPILLFLDTRFFENVSVCVCWFFSLPENSVHEASYSAPTYMVEVFLTTLAQSKMFKGTLMNIERAHVNDCSRVSKVSWKFHISTIYDFAVIYSWNFLKK